MHITRHRGLRGLLGALLTAAIVASLVGVSGASSHREAPMIAQDPVADTTDVYAFVAPDTPDMLTIVANYLPLQEPAGGPNFYRFGDDVLYRLRIDNDGDAIPDIDYNFSFWTRIQNPDTFLYNTGPITSIDDTDYNLRQVYSVKRVEGGNDHVLGQGLLIPPVNIGPRSTPDYEALAAEAVYEVGDGRTKVFAGQRDDPFWVDLGSIFDLGGLRPFNPAHLIPLPEADGRDTIAGYNVNTIAIQVPLDEVLANGDGSGIVGVWSTSERRSVRTLRNGAAPLTSGNFVQVSRLGNPLVNEVVIPLGQKDRFNNARPWFDARFLDSVVNPELGALLPQLYPGVFSCFPEGPRHDLVSIYLTGIEGVNQPPSVRPSEMLRINTGLPTGFPNGRNLSDPVTDASLRAIAGGLPGQACAGVSPNADLTDGVTGNDVPFLDRFPYVATPHQGYESDVNMSVADPGADRTETFTVTVENVSTAGLIDSDRAGGAVPLSPGAWVVFEGENPAFTPGEMADSGTTLIAEDGFPAPMPFVEDTTEIEILSDAPNAKAFGVFAAPGGTPDSPALFPGESASFTFEATEGDRLQFETMFVQSNDWFYSLGGRGISLFRGGEPLSGDITGAVTLYDAGTEVDAPPGQGPTEPPGAVQKPVQGPEETNVGDDENRPIRMVQNRHPDFDVPAAGDVIRVTVTSSQP